MAALLLRLAGPLQAWGDASRFTQRHTRPEPTKSGVLGLLAAAQGRRRSDPVEDLANLAFGVRVDQPGRLMRDFQTAIRWSDGRRMPLSYRYYLEDAVFVAGVEGDKALLKGLDDALKEPKFPPYLGRRSCPVTGRLRLGIRDGSLEDMLRGADWEAASWHRRAVGHEVDLTLLLDAVALHGQSRSTPEVVRDVPISFDPVRREYGWRDVVRAEPVRMTNPVGRGGLDFMAALGGV